MRHLDLLDEVALEVLKLDIQARRDGKHPHNVMSSREETIKYMADEAYALATAMVRASLAVKGNFDFVKIGEENET